MSKRSGGAFKPGFRAPKGISTPAGKGWPFAKTSKPTNLVTRPEVRRDNTKFAEPPFGRDGRKDVV